MRAHSVMLGSQQIVPQVAKMTSNEPGSGSVCLASYRFDATTRDWSLSPSSSASFLLRGPPASRSLDRRRMLPVGRGPACLPRNSIAGAAPACRTGRTVRQRRGTGGTVLPRRPAAVVRRRHVTAPGRRTYWTREWERVRPSAPGWRRATPLNGDRHCVGSLTEFSVTRPTLSWRSAVGSISD
jgi:hypothetical protein